MNFWTRLLIPVPDFRHFLLFLWVIGPGTASVEAQTPLRPSVPISDLLLQPHQEISAYDTSGFGQYQLAIRFPYGSARVLNPSSYDSIKAFGKISVEYIYTRYTQSPPSQKELDRARFEALQALAPDLFTDPGIRWDILVQNAAETADSARRLFHGFVISYQAPVTETSKTAIRNELDMLVDCAKKRPPALAPKFPGGTDSLQHWLEKNVKFPKDELLSKGSSRAALIEFQLDPLQHIPRNIRVTKGASAKHNEHIKAMMGKMPAWGKGKPGAEFALVLQFNLGEDGKGQIHCGPLRGYYPEDCKGLKGDSVVMKVLERNQRWKKLLVAEDVTGSMMPYVADLLLWNALKGNVKQTEHFVFFNDGDQKKDVEKEIGKTGGIYHTGSKNIDVLEETMISAIAGGEGGDTPENDIEAIIEGLQKCPECEEVVLISDNNATPRDLELLDKV